MRAMHHTADAGSRIHYERIWSHVTKYGEERVRFEILFRDLSTLRLVFMQDTSQTITLGGSQKRKTTLERNGFLMATQPIAESPGYGTFESFRCMRGLFLFLSVEDDERAGEENHDHSQE